MKVNSMETLLHMWLPIHMVIQPTQHHTWHHHTRLMHQPFFCKLIPMWFPQEQNADTHKLTFLINTPFGQYTFPVSKIPTDFLFEIKKQNKLKNQSFYKTMKKCVFYFCNFFHTIAILWRVIGSELVAFVANYYYCNCNRCNYFC